MTSLPARLKKLSEFDEDEVRKYVRPAFADTNKEDLVNGALQYHLKIQPLIEALIDSIDLVRHTCNCPRSSCMRKILSREEYELGCQCGREGVLARLDALVEKEEG